MTYFSILHRSIEHLGFSESDVCRLLAKRVFGKSDDYTRWHLVENKKDLPLPSVQMLSVIFLKGNDCIPIRLAQRLVSAFLTNTVFLTERKVRSSKIAILKNCSVVLFKSAGRKKVQRFHVSI